MSWDEQLDFDEVTTCQERGKRGGSTVELLRCALCAGSFAQENSRDESGQALVANGHKSVKNKNKNKRSDNDDDTDVLVGVVQYLRGAGVYVCSRLLGYC